MRQLLDKYERLLVYLPLVGTALVLILQDFFQGFLSDLNLKAAVAAVAIAIIFLIWYLETRIARFRNSFDRLTTEIRNTAQLQPALLQELTSNFQIISLGDAFRRAAQYTPKVKHLRIYAITSAQMVSFFEHSGITAEACSVLVNKAPANRPLMAGQIEAAIQGWRALVDNGRIGSVEIRKYDFFPTEYEAIFDSTFLIFGLFQPSETQTSGARVRHPIAVNSQSLPGARIISEFAERFDGLFQLGESIGDTSRLEPRSPTRNSSV